MLTLYSNMTSFLSTHSTSVSEKPDGSKYKLQKPLDQTKPFTLSAHEQLVPPNWNKDSCCYKYDLQNSNQLVTTSFYDFKEIYTCCCNKREIANTLKEMNICKDSL